MPPSPSPLRIGVAGCTGRVGSLIVRELAAGAFPDAALSAGLVRRGGAQRGADIGTLSGAAPLNVSATDDAELFFGACDVVIDFTAPALSSELAGLAARRRMPYVTGTTGLDAAQERRLTDAARETPVLYAANMSLGVNLLLALVKKTAAALGPEWDIEIAETHHRHKVDAPSGTALALGRAAAAGRGMALEGSNAVFERAGHTGSRPAGAIGFATQRGGDVAGEHTVSFFGAGERIELAHKATDRAVFAKGAIHAALWLATQKPGLYSMQDVLGL